MAIIQAFLLKRKSKEGSSKIENFIWDLKIEANNLGNNHSNDSYIFNI